MLFSGSSAQAKAKKDDKKEKKPEKDDRLDIQSAVFIRWANSVAPDTVKELADIVSTKFLSVYVQLITGEPFVSAGSRAQDILNALRSIDADERFAQINLSELVESNPKTICSLVWQLIQIFWRRYAPAETRDQKLVEGLKNWCVERAHRFDVEINDFTSSWRDGYALNAILLSYNPDLFNMDQIGNLRADERIEHAMRLAEEYLNVPRMLQPKDFHSEHLEVKCVVCYLMVLYLAINAQESPSISNRRRVSATKPPAESVGTTEIVAQSGAEQIPSLPAETQMGVNEFVFPNVDVRSRKSSTSSQRSSRRRSKVIEETISEFEECLEHVLTWLLDAEEQANTMDPIEEKDVEVLKVQFRGHERFMQSLTESQDSVGRVLHRGQLLCQKVEEERSASIVSQLLMVNARWEKIREVAMARQSQFQQRLNSLQLEQIESIKKWLDEMGEEISHARPLSLDVDDAEELIKEHSIIQERIENQQKYVRALSTFVAVVDESDAHFSYDDLEKLLQSVGQRWMVVCEWAEMRSHHLDGLPQLIAQYLSSFEQLDDWLKKREEEMSRLRSAHHLETDVEVMEQVMRLQELESTLEDGHSSFVALSQLAVNLVGRFDSTNGDHSNRVRQQVESITQRWDNIVARIDEHSQMLVKSGKAEAAQLQRFSSEDISSTHHKKPEIVHVDEDEHPSISNIKSTSGEEATNDYENDQMMSSTSTTLSANTVISPVDIFIANINHVSNELQPLLEWTDQFKVEDTADDIRSVIQICQGKLREIKEKEVKVNELHVELERIHNLDVSSSQLRLANDTFENFTRLWSRIVTKISDTLNSLSMQHNFLTAENEEESRRIVAELNEFLETAEIIVSNCAKISLNEREERVQKLSEQIDEQEKHVGFLENNFSDKKQIEFLKKRFYDLQSAVKLLNDESNVKSRLESFVQAVFPPIGDSDALTTELERCDNFLSELQNYSVPNPELAQLERLCKTKRMRLADYLQRSVQNDEKIATSESILAQLTDRFANLKNANLDVVGKYKQFKDLKVEAEKGSKVQKESVGLNEDIISIAFSSSASPQEQIYRRLKEQIQSNAVGWSILEEDIDERLKLLEDEIIRLFDGALKEYQHATDELKRAVTASATASDAEEFSEHLDNLESLCDKIVIVEKKIDRVSQVNEDLAKTKKHMDSQVKCVVTEAKKRIGELEKAISNCEQFDTSLAGCQAWCTHVQLVLSCRAASDVTALDVPHEYKAAFADGTLISQLQKEFDDFEHCIHELNEFIKKNTSEWKSPNRLQLQLDHVTKQFKELVIRFDGFKQPVALQQRLERLMREVSEMEINVDEFTGVQADDCKQALDHANDIRRRLSEALQSMEKLNETAKKLRDNQIFAHGAAQEFISKIVNLRKKWDAVNNHNDEMTLRMENGVAIFEELKKNMESVDASVENISAKMNVLRSTQFTNNDIANLETLLAELERNLPLVISGESSVNRLIMDSFKVDPSLVKERKLQLCTSEDRDSLINQFETFYARLKSSLAEMKKIQSYDELRIELEKVRLEKNAFTERYRRLLKSYPEVSAEFHSACSEIEKEWNELEMKSQSAAKDIAASKNCPKLKNIPIKGSYREQIGTLYDLYKAANDYLDFDHFPIASVPEWSLRLQEAERWMQEYGERLTKVMTEGKRLASSGRMELDLEEKISANKVEIVPIEAKWDTLQSEISGLDEVIGALDSRDLSDSVVAKATKHDILDRQIQIEHLLRKLEDLHHCLPGSSNKQPDILAEKIRKKITELEEKVDDIICKSAKGKDVQEDIASLESTCAPLSMEVQDTDDELMHQLQKVDSTGSEQLTMKVCAFDSNESFYTQMDRIEEALKSTDPLPYENIAEKQQLIKEVNEHLVNIKKAIDESQMTMDLLESEMAKKRLITLKKMANRKMSKVNEMNKEWESMMETMRSSSEMLDSFQNELAELEGRDQLPEFKKFEEIVSLLEDRLQHVLTQIQQASLKAEPILSQVSQKKVEEVRNQLKEISEKWKYNEEKMREKRRGIDERLADETELNSEIELLQFWCDEAESECSTAVHALNSVAVGELISKLEDKMNDFDAKRACLHNIEQLKDQFLKARLVDQNTKHRTRRIVSELGKRISLVRNMLTDRKRELDVTYNDAKQFTNDLTTLRQFNEKIENAIKMMEDATIYKPSGAELGNIQSLKNDIDILAQSIEDRWNKCAGNEMSVDSLMENLVKDALKRWIKSKEKLVHASSILTLSHDSVSESTGNDESFSEVRTLLSSIVEEKGSMSPSEHGTLDDSTTIGIDETHWLPNLPAKAQLLMDAIVNLGHIFTEIERDASIIVDIADVNAIRDRINQMQATIDQLKLRNLDLTKILDESQNDLVRTRCQLMIDECNRVLAQCQRRKVTLGKMIEDVRVWDNLCHALNSWLSEANLRVTESGKVDVANERKLRVELGELEETTKMLDEMKTRMRELNKCSDDMLDHYRADEGHNLSHATSRLNALWAKFNDNLRIRRAVLEAALRARSDFHSALGQLENWMDQVDCSLLKLNDATSNMQLLKDSAKRKEWMEDEKNVRVDINAHADLVQSVEEMVTQLMRRVEDLKEREELNERLSHVNIRWRHLLGLADAIRTRLTNAQEEWEKLFTQLSNNLFWVEAQCSALLDEQPIGGCLSRVQEQSDFVKNLEHEVTWRQNEVDGCITLAHSYLMQHNLRPRIRTQSVLACDDLDEENAEGRRVGVRVKTESEKLTEKWSQLLEQLGAWSKIVSDAHTKMERLTSAIAECELSLTSMEQTIVSLCPVEQLRLEQLSNAIVECQSLEQDLKRTRVHVDDGNDWSAQLLASDVQLTNDLNTQLLSINQRMSKLKSSVQIRMAALERAMTDFGPSSQHFLMNSVKTPPWQRAVSVNNNLPYYINHDTEVTQWDHPAMVEIMEELSTFNQVKFSAYRTAMKLRAIQKRLCLDLVTLEDVDAHLHSISALQSDQYLSMKDAVMCLVPLYEAAQIKFPKLIHSIPLAVDLIINFLLNVYDPARDGILRIVSFQVLLATLCNSSLEDKYKYLFTLVANNDGIDQKKLALLLYDIIHIPKFLGEAAAFGGSNVEPSVRSCFESAKFSRTITIEDFLEWLKKEPQSIVWLSVMHRLASAEFAKHQAKCNVCKMFPIIGFRYRCLRCFNVDICQNCFFSQRLAKNHKLSHPMQEYCLPTTSNEDMRDFGTIVKNKLRSKSKMRIGYLPVQTVDEGPLLEMSSVTPVNPNTEPIHNRVQLCARRLWRMHGEDNIIPITHPLSLVNPVESNTVELKSPLQLLSQVEQMHKEELDQVLYKLQHENRALKQEIEKRKKSDAVSSTPNLSHGDAHSQSANMYSGRSVPSLSISVEDPLLREAYLLRQHKERLEQRSRVLEEQNRQLETQLTRLRTIIAQQQRASNEQKDGSNDERDSSVISGDEDEGIEYDARPNRMHSLIASVNQIGRAMESFVVSVVNENDEETGDESNEDDVTLIGN